MLIWQNKEILKIIVKNLNFQLKFNMSNKEQSYIFISKDDLNINSLNLSKLSIQNIVDVSLDLRSL